MFQLVRQLGLAVVVGAAAVMAVEAVAEAEDVAMEAVEMVVRSLQDLQGHQGQPTQAMEVAVKEETVEAAMAKMATTEVAVMEETVVEEVQDLQGRLTQLMGTPTPASVGAAETVQTGHQSAASGATVKKVALVEEMDVVEAAAGGREWLSCMVSRTKNSIIQSKVGKMQGSLMKNCTKLM